MYYICCTQNAINNEMRIRFNDVQRRSHFGRFRFLIKTLNKNREKINQFEYFFCKSIFFWLPICIASLHLGRDWNGCELRVYVCTPLICFTGRNQNETKRNKIKRHMMICSEWMDKRGSQKKWFENEQAIIVTMHSIEER